MARSTSTQPDPVTHDTTSSHRRISKVVAATKSTSCYLLDVTRPEIRNQIYNLVIAPDEKEDRIELMDCTPPSKALLLTCQQICAEAKEMYRANYRAFWSKTHFEITHPTDADEKEARAKYREHVEGTLHAGDIAHVTKLKAVFPNSEWTFTDGVWSAYHSSAPRYGGSVLLVPKDETGLLIEADLIMSGLPRSKKWMCVISYDQEAKEVKEARKLTGKTALTPEELVALMKALDFQAD